MALRSKGNDLMRCNLEEYMCGIIGFTGNTNAKNIILCHLFLKGFFVR